MDILKKVLGDIETAKFSAPILHSHDFIPVDSIISPVGWKDLKFKYIGKGLWKCQCGCTLRPQSIKEWEASYPEGFFDSKYADPSEDF